MYVLICVQVTYSFICQISCVYRGQISILDSFNCISFPSGKFRTCAACVWGVGGGVGVGVGGCGWVGGCVCVPYGILHSCWSPILFKTDSFQHVRNVGINLFLTYLFYLEKRRSRLWHFESELAGLSSLLFGFSVVDLWQKFLVKINIEINNKKYF